MFKYRIANFICRFSQVDRSIYITEGRKFLTCNRLLLLRTYTIFITIISVSLFAFLADSGILLTRLKVLKFYVNFYISF